MSTDKRAFAEELKQIAERLDVCEQVRRYDQNDEKQAWTVAHDLVDLAESFRTYLDELLPRLKSGNLSADEVNEVLIDVGEEFRHILYHIHNSQYFAYLRDEIETPS